MDNKKATLESVHFDLRTDIRNVTSHFFRKMYSYDDPSMNTLHNARSIWYQQADDATSQLVTNISKNIEQVCERLLDGGYYQAPKLRFIVMKESFLKKKYPNAFERMFKHSSLNSPINFGETEIINRNGWFPYISFEQWIPCYFFDFETNSWNSIEAPNGMIEL